MTMKKYRVCYESKIDGDCCSVWCYANSKEDAIEDTKCEYWDVAEIIYVEEMR